MSVARAQLDGRLLRQLFVAVVVCLLSIESALAGDGQLSVFVFRDGIPVPETEFIVNEGLPFFADDDGFAQIDLPAGRHQLQIFVEDDTSNLAFFKEPFEIVADRDTQVIVRLTSTNELDAIDVNLPPGASSDVVTADSTAPVSGNDESGTNTSAESQQADIGTSDMGTSDITSSGAGFLSGTVVSAKNDQPIVGARVFLRGSTLEEVTDDAGQFMLSIPADTEVTVSVVHPDFGAETLNRLSAESNEVVSVQIGMLPAAAELQEFIVLAPNLEGEIESIIEEKRNTSAVAEVLGSEQFSKQGDSDAANALRRATGLTLIGGRFVYVRGLGERYSTSQLNGLGLPSPDPTRRVVPLDMFPTSVIGSIKVQKTWSSDLPANFGGGSIDIRTREAPDRFFGDFSASMRLTPGTTFSEVSATQTIGDGNFGFDGIRELSDATKDKVDIDQNIDFTDPDVAADLLRNPRGIQQIQALPGFKLSGSFGDVISRNSANAEKRTRFSWFGAYGYSQNTDAVTRQDRRAIFDSEGSLAAVSQFQTTDQSTQSVEHGGLAGATLELGLKHELALTNFFINLADDNLSIANSRSDGDAITYTNSWFERSLLVSQLQGRHALFDGDALELRWAYQQGVAEANEPLTPFYTLTSSDSSDEFDLDSAKINYQNNELSDELSQFRVGLNYRFQWLSESFSSLTAGIEIEDKERDARSRRFALFFGGNPTFTADELSGAIDTLDEDDVVKINLSSRPTESYTAGHDIDAAYLKTNIFPTDYLEIELGVRTEDSTQQVTSFVPDAEPTVLVSDKVLPAANLTYEVNEEMQVRLGYAESVARPDFREFSSTRYQDPTTADIVFGNEFLSFAELSHFDARFEWYMTETDNLTVGYFTKNIKRPIETVVFYTDVNPSFTYLNADNADLEGYEISWYRQLGAFSNRLRNWTVSGNYSYTESRIKLFDSLDGLVSPSLGPAIGELTEEERPMQGQSRYVLNLSLGYESRKVTSSLVFNTIGKRIVSLGTEGAPDLYEEPVRQLDLVTSYRMENDLKLGFSIRNILDEPVEWTQGGIPVRTFRKGRTIGLSVKYAF